jgi:hypothetical protein
MQREARKVYTREAIAERRALLALIRGFREDARAAVSALDAVSGANDPSRAQKPFCR